MNLQCLGKTILRKYLLRKTKKIFMDIFTRLYSPNSLQTPPVQKHSGPEKVSRKHIYTEDKIFWSHWTLQLREKYLQVTNKIYQTSSGAASNTDNMKIKNIHEHHKLQEKCTQ